MRPPVVALAALLLLLGWQSAASTETKTVCPQGPPTCQYATIRGAVNSGSYPLTQPLTIEVSPGTYRERVTIYNKDGTASNHLVIKAVGAPGTVIVDGSDPYHWEPVPGMGTAVWYTYIPWVPSQTQVFVDSIRYRYVPSGKPDDLEYGEYTGDAGAPAFLYINTGGAIDPNEHELGVTNLDPTRQRGFEADDSEYLTIEGFTVRRCIQEGIRVRGPTGTLHSVIVRNCTAAENRKRGIDLEDCTNCSIENNRARDNGSHGIYLLHSTNSQIARNVSYRNDDPDAARGSVAGIKVGDSFVPANVNNVTVDYNIAYDNEDSGIDLHGASDILVRGNCSYRNRDHGYDNLTTDRTTFVSNVAARNDHDGLSAEEDAFHVKIHNCIFALNAVRPQTLADTGGVREVFADTTVGFESDYNVIVGLPADDFEAPEFTGYYRRLVELRMPAAPAGRVRFNTLQGYRDSTYALDDNSKGESAAFIDSAAGVFRPRWASSAVDAADTTAVGWLPTDPSGVARHDCSG
jgi:parallel beta-helix repeat protein